ncbi:MULTISPECIES: class II glutamine amidotransferase [Haloferacaceae]|uniref:Class II glutamine amidotransferase n=1 Tax=Halorubrum glutamatedens TaxID=2707018 RepID=A0ABD5QPS2_9EURY|nr:class II glutamine amidotransferase [Halobellus captivus]
MCRFVAYHGPPMELDELLYRPDHSIIDQSMHAEERREPLNGDGWGVGWYDRERSPEPALHKRVRPAWNDDNMRHVSPLIETSLYFAHVRAASPGLSVQQLNCHPFTGGTGLHERDADLDPVERGRRRLLFMHNGTLGAHREVIRRVRESLDDEFYFGIHGSTDSEHAFAVIQDELGRDVVDPSLDDLAAAVHAALERLETFRAEVDEEAGTQANFCLTDGESIVATRYATPGTAAQSLYVGEAGSFESGGEFCSTPDPEGTAATIVASEALFENDRVWRAVPRNHRVTVEPDGTVSIDPIELDLAG